MGASVYAPVMFWALFMRMALINAAEGVNPSLELAAPEGQ